MKPESFGFCGYCFRLSKYVRLNDTNIGRGTGFVKRKLNVFNNKFINTNQAVKKLKSIIILLIYNILDDFKKVINIEIVFKLLTVAFLKFITRRGNLSG